ncbi:hypothetical protein HPB52_018511 [Rhipicephalus sanguineus]|uniref:Uncharacterized protein n=1 Tax=Rhipicephalus sanguineus TaxID=34632 RepID=A0A9D4QBR3_RHISA|nr:hypothetical protein HPB52_018511 [Rhipicephalus sanguineus]
MPPVGTRQPLNAAHYSELIGQASSRYEEKVRLCDGVDPYTLRLGTDTSSNISVFPDVSQVRGHRGLFGFQH